VFKFDNGYLVGFFGEYDDESITYLGCYTASFNHINYYSKRPYIFLYKKILSDKTILPKIAADLGFDKDENGRYKGQEGGQAKLTDTATRVLFYLLDVSQTNPDLFANTLQYLYF